MKWQCQDDRLRELEQQQYPGRKEVKLRRASFGDSVKAFDDNGVLEQLHSAIIEVYVAAIQ